MLELTFYTPDPAEPAVHRLMQALRRAAGGSPDLRVVVIRADLPALFPPEPCPVEASEVSGSS